MFNKHPALEIPEKDEDLLDTGKGNSDLKIHMESFHFLIVKSS